MRRFTARALLWLLPCLLALPATTAAEVSGLHLNLTPYLGYASWAKETNMENDLLYGGRVGLGFGKRFGIEGSYGRSTSQTQEGDGGRAYVFPTNPANVPQQDSKFTHISADALLNILPGSSLNPYILGGWSSQEFEPQDSTGADSKRDGFNIGAGVKLHFNPRVALRLEARDMIYSWSDEEQAAGASDKSQSSFAFTGGLQLSLGGGGKAPDEDADGIPDKKDSCPGTPVGAVIDAKGCPVDSDGDGVPDGIDTCAGTVAGAKVDAKGCPTDEDSDGVVDGIDTCPGTLAGCTVDAKGCPSDADADGVCDGLDQCASTPTGATVDAKGCPTDADGDGVPDGIDQCPNTPANVRVDVSGCPIEVTTQEMEMLEKGAITAKGLVFDSGKTTLKPESEKTLQDLCAIFQQWPTLQVEIGGHTDSKGSDAVNQKLSEGRAQAVRDWMSANCAKANLANLTYKGYGESQPIASNKTAEGMAKNRRVEFKVLNPEELKRLRERREMLLKETPK
ncbi:MAG TPA: OmpA family protein [Candidatus Eisenbacteria bacterium]|nr:OmpA family protein [Candidatus Eisenbacteria bacterium]